MDVGVGTSGPKLLVIERLLRDRVGIWDQIAQERDLGQLTGSMLASSAIALACYGAVLGASHSVLQALLSAVKLPLLFGITLAICLPTLYLFNLIFGARLSMMQAVTLIMVCITVIAVLSLAFAPISLFFLISADNYPFFKLLNVAVLVVTSKDLLPDEKALLKRKMASLVSKKEASLDHFARIVGRVLGN